MYCLTKNEAAWANLPLRWELWNPLGARIRKLSRFTCHRHFILLFTAKWKRDIHCGVKIAKRKHFNRLHHIIQHKDLMTLFKSPNANINELFNLWKLQSPWQWQHSLRQRFISSFLFTPNVFALILTILHNIYVCTLEHCIQSFLFGVQVSEPSVLSVYSKGLHWSMPAKANLLLTNRYKPFHNT